MENTTLWDACVDGCYFLIPLAIIFLISVYVFIERTVLMGKALKNDSTFMQRIRDYLHEGEIESAMNLCKSSSTPVARIVAKGLTRLGRPIQELQLALDSVIKIEIQRLRSGMVWLWMTVTFAPMAGLLGTIIGMSRVFDTVSVDSIEALKNEVSASSAEMAVALITFMAGLTVGMLAVAGYAFLKNRLNKVSYTLEENSLEFLDVLNEK
ncbi:MAG: MotA/TolQ/ExbB proton channel family protein [Muribaculaceae bacterium]|nr:MotA/TolQ/ExbB proton channel family protein [Muribaculaceae bacterium]